LTGVTQWLDDEQQQAERSFVLDLVQFNRLAAFATHVVIHCRCKEMNVIEPAIDDMSFFGHYLDKVTRIATIRTRASDKV
jgi:hypothetical protein